MKSKSKSLVFNPIFAVLVFLTTGVYGQSKIIKGSLSAENGEKLSFGQISAHDSISASPIAFTSSNAEGNFVIKVKNRNKIWLCGHYLGYEKQCFEMNLTDSISLQNFVLKTKDLHIKEVVIAEPMDVKVKGDTLVFKMEKYARDADMSLEDALKRMPGMRVGKDGTIFFQGQKISKILMDGDDLTGNAYQILSKSISPAMIEEVEVIKNFMENPLLKDIADGNQTIINLKLKQGIPHFFGDAKMGGSNDGRHSANLNLFALYKKTKLLLVGNANDIGYEGANQLRLSENHLYVNDLTLFSEFLLQENSSISVSKMNFPPNEMNNYPLWQNRSKMASMNVLQRFSKNFSARINHYSSFDERKTSKNSESNFVNAAGENYLKITENDSFFVKPTFYFTEVLGTYMLSDKAKIDFLSVLKMSDANGNNSLSSSLTKLSAQNLTKNLTFNQKFEFTKRMLSKKAFILKADFFRQKNDENFSFSQFPFRPMPDSMRYFSGMAQNNIQNQTTASLDAALFQRTKNVFFRYRFGNRFSHLNFRAELKAKDSLQEELKNAEKYQNNVNFVQNDAFFAFMTKKNYGNWDFTADVSLHFFSYAVFQAESEKTENHFIPQADLKISRRLNDVHKLLYFVKYNNTLPNFRQFLPNYYLTSYRSFMRGTQEWANIENIQTGLFYYMDNYSINGRSMRINFSYGKSDKNYTMQNFVDNQFSFLSSVLVFQKFQSFALNVNAAQKIKPLQIVINFDGNLNQIKGYNSFNSNDLRKIETTNYTIEMQFSSLWKKSIYNLEVGAEISGQENYLPETKSKTSNQNYVMFFNSNFELKNGIFFKIMSENYTAKTTGMKTNYFTVLHFNFGAHIWKKKLLLEISGNNLLNTQTYRLSFSSDIFNSSQSYQLLPRFFLGTVKFKF